jgi:hypothetical protein
LPQLEITGRGVKSILINPLSGGVGALIGGLIGGPIALIASAGVCALGSHMVVTYDSASYHSAMDAGRLRIDRLVDKINQINQIFFTLDNTSDQNQLNHAKNYFQMKVDPYNFLKEVTLTGGRLSNSHTNVVNYYDKDGNAHAIGTLTSTNQQNFGSMTRNTTTTYDINK